MDDARNQPQEDQPVARYFHAVPDDLLLEIFKTVSHTQLQQLALVCPRFNKIINDERIWKRVVVHRCLSAQLAPRVLVTKLMRRQVQTLVLCNITVVLPPLLRQPLETTPPSWRLQELRLNNVGVHVEDLAQMLSKCEQLRNVAFTTIDVNKHVLVALARNTDIEFLCLDGVEGIEPVGLGVLLRNLAKLQTFFFALGDNYTSTSRGLIFSICVHLTPTLWHLLLGVGDQLTDNYMALIVNKFRLLHVLDIKLCLGYKLTPKSLEIIRGLKYLRVLAMPYQNYYLPPRDYLPLTQMESLVELDISTWLSSCQVWNEIEQVLEVRGILQYSNYRTGQIRTQFGHLITLTY